MFRKTLIFIIFVLSFASFVSASVLLDRVVAIVDRDVITWSELYKAMAFEYEANLANYSKEEKRMFFEARQEQFLDRLIDMRLQIADARKKGISVSDREVKYAIDDTREKLGMNLNQFKDALKQEGFAYEDYVKRMREQILIQKYVQYEIKAKIVVSDKEVDEYFVEHKHEFPLELSYRLMQLKLKKPVSESDEIAIDTIISGIQERVLSGVDFDQIVNDLSDNPYVLFAGDTDYIKAGNIRKDLLEVLDGLKEGEVTPPLKANDGIYIIKLTSRQLPVKNEVIIDNIRELLISKKSKETYENWAKALRRRALIEILL
jgi:peptidyl-prolyl cis-trans isomerase SurA